jgi:hypothetical protein
MSATFFAALPEPADTDMIGLGLSVGSVVMYTWSRLRRHDEERQRAEAFKGAQMGGVMGAGICALAYLLELVP